MKNPLLLPLLFLAPWLAAQELAPDRVVHLEKAGAKAMFVLPGGVEHCRGVIVHVANMKREPSPRWTEIARSLDLGHLVLSIDMKQNNRPRKLRDALDPVLARVAETLGRPEIATAPIASTGHSAGGMGLPALSPLADRFITAANDCSWAHNYEKNPEVKAVPLLFIIGSLPDGFKMLEAIPRDYDPGRRLGALATLGFEWDKAHSFGNAGTLMAAWFQSVVPLRLPAEGTALQAIAEDAGWLGDRATWEGHDARIAPFADYEGDRGAAVWLPDGAFAHVWRAFQSKNPPVQLSAASANGEIRLPSFKASTAHEMEVPAGSGLTLGLEIRQATAIASVRYFLRDQVLGTGEAEPWTLEWKNVPPGAHVVFAEIVTADGQRIVTHPALLLSRAPREQTVQTLEP